MKEMTLRDIQKVSFEILSDVHSFCESHHIRYSLAYGTLLGAVRHKGFIPWDDDVDIIIPRPDFERFCREYKSEHDYELYKPGDSRSFLTFARVCDNNRTSVVTNRPWSTEPTGIWIDVFPLDGVPEDISAFNSHVKSIRTIAKKIYRLRFGKYLRLSDTRGLKDFIYCLAKKILYSRYNLHTQIQSHIRLLKKYSYDKEEFVGQICVMDYPEKEHNPKADFESFIKTPFEGKEFYVMKGYDNVLTRYYGDYMVLPPQNKRVPPQSTTQNFYWK